MLYLWMPDAEQHWRWSIGEQWQTAASLDELKDVVAVHQLKHATVFFSSLHVQHAQFQLQKAHFKQLGDQGVRYLIEDQLIESVDQVRLSYVYANDKLSMMAINKSRLDMMQHSLGLVSWQIEALLPDYFILPIPKKDQVILKTWGGQYLLRQGEFQGASIDDLDVFCEFLSEEQQVVISEDDLNLYAALSERLGAERIVREPLPEVFVDKFKRHRYNLWQSASKEQSISPLWKACAAALCLAIAVQLINDGVRWYKLKQVSDQTAQLMIDQYKQWFGQGYRVTEQNIKSDFEARVRLSQSADLSSLSLLSRIGPVMTQQNVIAERIQFQDNILTIDLKAANASVLENMTKQLNQQGFKAQLGNIQTVGNQVLGWIKVQ